MSKNRSSPARRAQHPARRLQIPWHDLVGEVVRKDAAEYSSGRMAAIQLLALADLVRTALFLFFILMSLTLLLIVFAILNDAPTSDAVQVFGQISSLFSPLLGIGFGYLFGRTRSSGNNESGGD